MKARQAETQRRFERFERACRGAGAKLTHQRAVIFRELARTSDHPDAETIYRRARKKIPTLSLDTVYRTLWLFNDLGLITTLGPPRARARFDANTSPHHHFLCTRCGAAQDFYSRQLDDLEVPDEVKAMGDIESVRVEARGLCLRCRERRKTG